LTYNKGGDVDERIEENELQAKLLAAERVEVIR